MVQMTIQVPDELEAKLRPIQRWVPAILSLGLGGFKTAASETAAEIIGFLSQNPTPEAVAGYHLSDRAQRRLQRLLTLNQAGLLGEGEQRELDEAEEIEHIMVMLKTQVTGALERAE